MMMKSGNCFGGRLIKLIYYVFGIYVYSRLFFKILVIVNK